MKERETERKGETRVTQKGGKKREGVKTIERE